MSRNSPQEARTSAGKTERPRERLVAAAGDLFWRLGIRGVGVEAVAEAAHTNKMTLYRHFASKDALVAEWLRRLTEADFAGWARLEALHPGDPAAQLLAWIDVVEHWLATSGARGCPYANSLAELPDPAHPARQVIKAHKTRQRRHFADLLRRIEPASADVLADELFFLVEGARASAHGIGMADVPKQFGRVARALVGRAVSGTGNKAAAGRRRRPPPPSSGNA